MITKQAANEAYELGVSLALKDAGLNKTAADPGRLRALWNSLKEIGSSAGREAKVLGGGAQNLAMSHPALAGAGVGGGATALGGGDLSDIMLGAGAGAGLGLGAKGYMAGKMGKGFAGLGERAGGAGGAAGADVSMDQFLKQQLGIGRGMAGR